MGTILAGVLICILFAFISLQDSIALDQEIRCGIQEHTHMDFCYDGDFLVCERTAHAHDGNCYIVLLQENNIDQVLGLMKEKGTNSLEYVIKNVMSDALVRNRNMLSMTIVDGKMQELVVHDDTEDDSLTQEKVVQMNQKISEKKETSNLVLNEKLNNETDEKQFVVDNSEIVESGEVDQVVHENTTVAAVGDTPNKSNTRANFYIHLDGKWTCIGTLTFTVGGDWNNQSQNCTLQTSEILNLVNNSLGTNYDYTSFDLSVATSENGTYSKVEMASVTTTLASKQDYWGAIKARYVRLIPDGGKADSKDFAFHTVEFVYPDGTVAEARYVRKDTNITLPTGNYEWKEGKNTYAAGASVKITKKTTFTGTLVGPVSYVNVKYNVGFPTVSGVTINTKPTIAGLTSQSVTDGYTEGSSATIRNVSQQTVEGKVNNNSTNLSRVVQFRGWRVENTDTILQPNTTLIWEELLQYATGGTINLTAIWEYSALQTASFFIRFDSVAVDTNGNITNQDSNKYTKELFSAYVGGVDTSMSSANLTKKYGIADTTADNSYGADQAIRALYGEKTNSVWLSALPTDDYIFQSLVEYANTGYLSVGGVAVKAEDLNEREYAIRWYVFKSQDDAWHIDGKLVKKEGLIHVYKTFAGNKELIECAKRDFYISAENNKTGKDARAETLSMTNYKEHNASTDTYMWELNNVDYGELWTITEHPHTPEKEDTVLSTYSEYTVVDAHGDQSTTSMGHSLSVSGMTYALDEGIDEVLRVSFTNIYNKVNSIVIKKQDSLTSNSIGGATFQLLQNGQVLKFNYNTTTESYEYAPETGTYTVLSGTASGYFEISIEDFSYDNGPITIREITAPEGYTPIGDIEIGYTTGNTVGILSGNSDLIKYIDGVLIIGNSTDSSTVTVQKVWECPENEWQDVKIQLLANGKLATTVIAGISPEVTLNGSNSWKYTWNNLPVYVNGEKIQWTVKEVQIGSEQCKSDGSFINWLVSYELPVYSQDAEGNEQILLKVNNTTKRVMLRLTKTDLNKTKQLEGATFLLEAVDSSGNVLTNEVAKTATTGSSGTLTFDNLKSNVRYRLTETNPPIGYLNIDEYIFFMINEDGSVTVEENFFAEAGDTAYNILVKNAAGVTLPETGGSGNFTVRTFGFAIMAVAICMYAGTILRRRCKN